MAAGTNIQRIGDWSAPALEPGWDDTALRRLGLALLCAFLFFAYSRVLDLTLWALHLPLVFSITALLCSFLTNSVRLAFATRLGRLLLAFTAWMAVCVPFAFWKGEAYETFSGAWMKCYLLFVLLASLLRTPAECRRAMNLIGYGVAIVSMLAIHAPGSVRGRLILDQTALNNPNDLAQAILLGLPFLAIMTLPGAGAPRRVFGTVAIAMALLVAARTGSRGALVTAAICVPWFFVRSPLTTKVKILVLAPVCLTALLAAVPAELRGRYLTLFSSGGADDDVESSASASAQERKQLLLQSLKITLQHPLFGVGPGNFYSYSAGDSKASGQRARWRQTHNAYTQVSSELGIPGIALYLWALVHCFRKMSALSRACRGRPELESLRHSAEALRYSLAAYAITAFFSSSAYALLFPTIAGLCAALASSAEPELAAANNELTAEARRR
jgi:O-antigen ligase